jgi:Flp pilus assembly CpaE family ATPase
VVLKPISHSPEPLAAFGIDAALSEEATWTEVLASLDPYGNENRGAQPAHEHNPMENIDSSPRQKEEAAVIAVWGPAGAPGRSVVAINTAAEIALTGKRVLLIDADTYGGSVAGYLELFDEAPGFLAASRLAHQGLLDAAELARVSHIYRVGSSAFTVLSGMVNPARWPELSPARVRSALEILSLQFDCLVIDVGFNLEADEEIVSDLVGPRRNQATLEILRQSSSVVAICGADVIGVARFIHALPELRECSPQASLHVVANRARSERSSNASAVKHALSRFAGLEDVYDIPLDVTSFTRCEDMASPLALSAPKCAARVKLREMALEVLVSSLSKEPVAG